MALAASLLEAAARGDSGLLGRLLKAKSCPLEAVDENGCSSLQRAAADGHVEVVQLLLQHGAKVNKQDAVHGNTALHEAAWKGYSRCVSLLCHAGAVLPARNAGGFAALHLACQNGHNQSCRELLLAGSDPDQQNNYGDTAVHTAARYGHAGVTRILISAQCRVSEQNKNGDTALHIAAAMGRRKLTRILLESGCDKSLRNQQNETAREIAQRKGLVEIITILNTPISKQAKKKHKDKSRDKNKDEIDEGMKPKEKSKNKKKKNVHFETNPPVQWSPYGCHYYPDPKYFPKPRLSSLPAKPLQKGEQYYLDLAGNIKKGPIGAGYTCYCAPFFKHMENKMNEDKVDLKKHIDRAHERLDQKVTDLEMKTQGQLSELTRYVAAERVLCKERHVHLEQWLTRGKLFRASERVRRLDYSPRGSFDIPPLKRTRSLEMLDANMNDWSRVHRIIKNFNHNTERYESDIKELNEASKITSKSTEVLENCRKSQSPTFKSLLKNSKSSDYLDRPRRTVASPYSYSSAHTSPIPSEISHEHNITAQIHGRTNNDSVSKSPICIERFPSPSRQSHSKSPNNSIRPSSYSKSSDCESDNRFKVEQNITRACSPNVPLWKSQVLQRTADDIRRRVLLEKEMSFISQNDPKSGLDISQDNYIKVQKQTTFHEKDEGKEYTCDVEALPRTSVQEMVAKVEQKQRICESPEPILFTKRNITPTEILMDDVNTQPKNKVTTSKISTPQQPLRPAPILTNKPPKNKRFSLHNLIPFPTRKTFQSPPNNTGSNSESSDEEDHPVRTINQPGPMRNANLLQTLPLPNYETMSNNSTSPTLQLRKSAEPENASSPIDLRSMVPKDAYFHDIPNRRNHQILYREMVESGLPLPQYTTNHNVGYNETGLPTQNIGGRNRSPMYHANGIFDAMMQDHIMREMERIPHCYSEKLDQNTEVEISNGNDHFRDCYYDNHASGLPVNANSHECGPQELTRRPFADHNLLHSRLQSLAINTHLGETQGHIDRECHNDSGYSTKVYGSSQGPSPSLSGHVDGDNLSGQRVHLQPNGKSAGNSNLIGASSLV